MLKGAPGQVEERKRGAMSASQLRGCAMAEVQVPATWVAQNYFPPICARHGKPATSVKSRAFNTRTPGWCYVLILVAVLVFVIVAMSMRKTVKGQLPACADCSRDRRRFFANMVAGCVGSIALITSAVAVTSGALVIVGFVALLAALLFGFAGDYFRVAGHLSDDQVWVHLKGVDEKFANAINNALRGTPTPAAATPGPYHRPLPAQPTGPYEPTPNILPGR
ncbi:MAG: hypothetical protein ABJA81_12400 [Nocardioidaceae bacterium]